MVRAGIAGVVLAVLAGWGATAQERAQSMSRAAFYAETRPGTLGFVIDGLTDEGCGQDFTRVAPLEGNGWFRLNRTERLCLVANHIDPDNPAERLTLTIETTKFFERVDADDPPSVDTLMFRTEKAPSSFRIPFLRRDSVGGRSPVLLSLGASGVSAMVVQTSANGDLSFRRRAAFLLN